MRLRLPLRTIARSMQTALAGLTAAGVLFVSVPGAAAAAENERIPDDTYISQQWHLFKIGAPQAWVSTVGFEGIPIAVIDSGVDLDHPDLRDNVWRNLAEVAGNGIDDDRNGYVDDVRGWDFVGDDNDPRPDVSGPYDVLAANHGTVDAGIAAARGGNGRGIAGVSWQSSVMVLRALDSRGNGNPGDVVRAVEYAMHNGAKVISLSFAGPAYSRELAIALRRAYDAGVFVVAAAGNAPDGGEATDLDVSPRYPACLDADSDENFVYGVAAVDENDFLVPASNYGAGCVDVSAPGNRLISTQFTVAGNRDFAQPYGGYYSGTSLAAAEVAGAVALIRSLDHKLTPKQVMNLITQTAANIDRQNPARFGKYGRGRINLGAAVQAVVSRQRPQPAAVPTSVLLPAGSSGRVVVATPGPGRATDISVFTEDGLFVRSFSAFAPGFRGGASLALADFEGGGKKTVVVGALAGGSPQVRIFDINSRLLGTFLAYDGAFKGGVSLAAADLDADGRDEIVTGAGPGGGPHVRTFTSRGVATGGFFAFDRTSRLGVSVAAGDIDGDRKAEVVAWQPGGQALRVFDARGALVRSVALPYRAAGVTLLDADDDDRKDVIVHFAAGAGVPAMRAYRADGTVIADLDAEGRRVALAGPRATFRDAAFGSSPGPRATPTVTVVGDRGIPLQFVAFESLFRGGVSAGLSD